MRTFLIIIGLVSFGALADNGRYSVQVSIDGEPDRYVLDRARKAVLWDAALDYPVLISGTEKIVGDDYSSEIAALTAGAIDVEDIEIKWEREAGTLYYTGEASLNQSISLQMIEGVKDNIKLQQELSNVYQILDAAMKSELIDATAFEQGLDDAQAVRVVHYLRNNLADSLKAKRKLKMHFERFVLRNILKPIVQQAQFTLVDFTENYVVYEMDFSDVLSDTETNFGEGCKLYPQRGQSIKLSVVPGSCQFSTLYDGTPIEMKRSLPFEIVAGTSAIEGYSERSYRVNEGRFKLTYYGNKDEVAAFIQNPERVKNLITIAP